MKRMVIVQLKDGSVSCLPVSESREYYEKYYEVIAYCNRLWNPYHVTRIKSYYQKKNQALK